MVRAAFLKKKMNQNVEMEVNGITVEFNMSSGFSAEGKPVYTLLRAGDDCLVEDGGIIRKGVVQNIIRLSSGKTLFSVKLINNILKEWDLFEGEKVSPPNPLQCMLRLTAFEMLLRQYEPKGQSTNVSLWGTER